jgi:uncharacterized protein (DUF433 family)
MSLFEPTYAGPRYTAKSSVKVRDNMIATSQSHGDRIVQDPEILFGKPSIKGTRIPVAVVLEYLAENPDFEDLFADYPRLTLDDVKACFEFAQALVEAVPKATRIPAPSQR